MHKVCEYMDPLGMVAVGVVESSAESFRGVKAQDLQPKPSTPHLNPKHNWTVEGLGV